MRDTDGRKRNIDRCCNCGIVKTKENTGRNIKASNGFQSTCKKCYKEYRRIYRKHYKKDGPSVRNQPGITSMCQVDSVLREMSELQHQINAENDLCEQRKNMVEEYTREINEPHVLHQLHLRTMLTDFMKENYSNNKSVKKCFRFGSICYERGKLVLELKPKLAGDKRGKP